MSSSHKRISLYRKHKRKIKREENKKNKNVNNNNRMNHKVKIINQIQICSIQQMRKSISHFKIMSYKHN